jgi:hypothetical protein
MQTETWAVIAAMQVAFVVGYIVGRVRGKASERARWSWQIDRLFQEGRLSASLRILRQRLQGNEDYDEPRQSDIARNRIAPEKEST